MSLVETAHVESPADHFRNRLVRDALSSVYHATPHLRVTRIDDATILLDQRTEQYYTLNGVGGRIWELLNAGVSVKNIVKALLDEYDVSESQLNSDVTTTIHRLLAHGLIAVGALPLCSPRAFIPRPAQQTPLCRTPRTPSILNCLLTISTIKLALRVMGFNRTVTWVRLRAEKAGLLADVSTDSLARLDRAVATAAALFPGRALCLEQSLALYYHARRTGVDVQFQIGVRPYPFEAHAWVEHKGNVINDAVEHVRHFMTLPDIGV